MNRQINKTEAKSNCEFTPAKMDIVYFETKDIVTFSLGLTFSNLWGTKSTNKKTYGVEGVSGFKGIGE